LREEYTGEGKDKAAQARGRKGGGEAVGRTTCKILEDLQIS
jgi:hypothetical protein